MLDKECEIFGDYVKDMKSIKGKSTAYICKDFNCEIPTTNINKMKELLNKNIGNKLEVKKYENESCRWRE